jgi:hypothetical protein
MRHLQRNPATSIFFFLACVLIAFSKNNIEANLNNLSSVQELARQSSAKEWKMKVSEQSTLSQKEIAENRLRNGCIIVVAEKNPKFFTSLSEGQPVIDSVRKTPLPPGSIVCDINGNTGKIIETENGPVVSDLAFTGNRKLIEQGEHPNFAKIKEPNLFASIYREKECDLILWFFLGLFSPGTDVQQTLIKGVNYFLYFMYNSTSENRHHRINVRFCSSFAQMLVLA